MRVPSANVVASIANAPAADGRRTTKSWRPSACAATAAIQWKKGGFDAKLSLLEPATAFNRAMERKYEMTLQARAAAFYPSPYQYFHSDFVKNTPSNNLWGFGSEDTDKLIDTFRFDMDKGKRIAAMHALRDRRFRNLEPSAQNEDIHLHLLGGRPMGWPPG